MIEWSRRDRYRASGSGQSLLLWPGGDSDDRALAWTEFALKEKLHFPHNRKCALGRSGSAARPHRGVREWQRSENTRKRMVHCPAAKPHWIASRGSILLPECRY